MNIAENLERTTRGFRDKTAIIFENRRLTYHDLQASVDQIARGMASRGVDAGDRVGLFLPNIPEFVITYLATQKIGGIAVAINTMLTTEELRYVLADSGARLVFTTEDLVARVEPALGNGLERSDVIICEGEVSGFPRLADLALGGDEAYHAVEMNRDDPAAILYTSGTTGRQKGAVLTHGNVVSNMFTTGHAIRVTPEDRLLLFLPLFHCFGQNFLMNTAINFGATIVLHRRFVPNEVLRSIVEDEVSMFFAVPAVYILLLNAGLAPEQLAGVRYFFSAAATMPVEVAARWNETFGKPVYEGYGLTETSPFACYNHEWGHRPGSVGTPLEMVEMRVVDPEDHPVAVGTWGEIVIKGPNVMRGYWNRPTETAEALRGGWFHTGDIGYMDADGYFYLVDRVKDMINVSGYKIWPREVEEVLYRHPIVKECAVVGIPDPLTSESTLAVVVPQAGKALTEEELDAYCREHLAIYKVPKSFSFVDELPKSATGKILKRVLREQAHAKVVV